MTQIKASSIRAVILDILKQNLSAYTIWDTIEGDLILKCTNLPEVTSEAKKKELLKGLRDIKKFLQDKDVDESKLKFLDEEIDRYKYTKQISLYEETEDMVEQEVINKYARMGTQTEGVVGIHLAYSYEQLKRLTNGVYNKTGLIKFYISREKTIYGKVVSEVYQFPQRVPIATLVESVATDKDTGLPNYKGIKLFGELWNKTKLKKIKEIQLEFYVYKFISEHNQELVLLTLKPVELGDYIITGVTTQCDDYKALTDSAKLKTKLPFFFAQECRGRIIKYKDHAEFRKKLSDLNVSKKNLFNMIFTIKSKGKQYLLKHPEWFKWLSWSWLAHAPVGMKPYPLHILFIGPPGTGKSWWLNTFHARSKESLDVFSGSSSTLKKLVPSYKYRPMQHGYLAESNRFSFCDEFLRCLINTKGAKEGGEREESVGLMNDLLEHQKRVVGSGVVSGTVTMSSRILATSNPLKGAKTIQDMLNRFDKSFLCRWLIVWQSQKHIDLIRESRESQLPEYKYSISDEDFIGILDYLHLFPSEYDKKKLEEIYQSVIPVLSDQLKGHYSTRHIHHLECVLDGVIKARCLFERDVNFKATDEDYKITANVWKNVIRSWIDGEHIGHLPIKERIFYLPENCQYIYWEIVELKRPASRKEVKELALEEMKPHEYLEAMTVLLDMGVLFEDDGAICPHYLKKTGKLTDYEEEKD